MGLFLFFSGNKAPYRSKWQHTARNGNIPLEMAPYHSKWHHTTRNGNIPLEMATYHSKWQHTTRNGRVSLGCTRKALIEKGSGETLDPSSGDGEYSVYDQFLSSSSSFFLFLANSDAITNYAVCKAVTLSYRPTRWVES